MAKTIYTYEIVANNTAIVTDLESRSIARDELKLVKKTGYTDAKIIQRQYVLVKEAQVR